MNLKKAGLPYWDLKQDMVYDPNLMLGSVLEELIIKLGTHLFKQLLEEIVLALWAARFWHPEKQALEQTLRKSDPEKGL